jgi:hypothetical protein
VKKVARLKWIQETFGKDFVLPYRVCKDQYEIHLAICIFEMGKKTWGMRTDTSTGQTQGFNLPFLFKGTPEGAAKIWDEHQHKLEYIVSENVLKVRLQAVAVKLDPEHVFFEWNDKEPEISQRQMYRHPENLRQIVLGPSNYVFPWDGQPMRSVRPEYAASQRFDKIYDVMVHSDVDEATFTVRDDGKLVVW